MGTYSLCSGHLTSRVYTHHLSGCSLTFLVLHFLSLSAQFRESSTGATENGDLPDDTAVITKDLPSDLHSTFAEDSNVSEMKA